MALDRAIMDSEADRNLLQNLTGITGAGYAAAYDKAAQQFNTEQGRQQTAQDAANTYGLAALARQADLGAQQQAIESEGVAADYAQFREERDFRTNKFSTCSPCRRGFRWPLSRIRTRSLAHWRRLCRLPAVLWAIQR